MYIIISVNSKYLTFHTLSQLIAQLQHLTQQQCRYLTSWPQSCNNHICYCIVWLFSQIRKDSTTTYHSAIQPSGSVTTMTRVMPSVHNVTICRYIHVYGQGNSLILKGFHCTRASLQNMHHYIETTNIRESVDSLCRVGKACTRPNLEDLSLFRYLTIVYESLCTQ